MNVLDWIIIAGYALALWAVTRKFSGSAESENEYFRASRALGIFPVCLSIIATETSAATFIGAPDTAFRANLLYLQTAIGTILSRFIVARLFLDKYYSQDISTVYEFVRHCFGRRVEMLVSAIFVVGRVLGSAARLFIACYAVSIIVGINVPLAIVVVGLVSLLYVHSGGLRVVIWTDVFQGILFLLAGVITLIYLGFSLDLSLGSQSLQELGKLQIFDTRLDVSSAEFWAEPYTLIAALLGGCTLGLATHATDQDMVQRMLACRNSADAKRSLLSAAAIEVFVAVLFTSIGLGLWLYFRQHGVPDLASTESAFPVFIRDVVPIGLRGLLVAALLAAAMSSLDSAVTALASVSVFNFSTKNRTETNQQTQSSRQGRNWSIVWGLVLIGVAVLLAEYQRELIESVALAGGSDSSRKSELLTLALGLLASLYGPILGVFILGVFGLRRGAYAALVGGAVVSILMRLEVPLTFGWTWHITFSSFVSILVGFSWSRLGPYSNKQL